MSGNNNAGPAAKRKQSVAPKRTARSQSRSSKEEAGWTVKAVPVPARRLTDVELQAARRMFFDLDRDGSGSIEAEELGTMLRSLGQCPTDDECVRALDCPRSCF